MTADRNLFTIFGKNGETYTFALPIPIGIGEVVLG